ncbi:MAG: T9SS type A sorting domain-containing protein [Paludibacteraceae bacterium]|nr:T9SS type A sorting domain-containing protein [Paludibacteraceae bacterium]
MMNKTVATLFLSSFACLSSMAATSYEQAKTVVKNYVENTLGLENYQLFGNENSLSKVEISFEEPVKVDPSGWTFFIDMMPQAMWGHQAKVVSVSKENESMVINDVNMPLENLDGWSDITPVFSSLRSASANEPYAINSIKYDSNHFLSKGQFKTTGKTSPNSYAVLYCGGSNRDKFFLSFWNDCALTYQLLRDVYGIPPENIYVLMSGGPNNTTKVMSAKTGEYVDMPLDLDRDGKDDVLYSSDTSDIKKVFDLLKGENAKKQIENLFVYVTAHGICSGGEMTSWGKVKIKADWFAKELDKVNAKSISVVMNQCYSGSFIPALSKNGTATNRTIITAVSPNETGVVECDNSFYYLNCYFTKAFMCGLSDPEESDYDGDGEVSMLEAFRFAQSNNLAANGIWISGKYFLEKPQYWSADCLGEKQLANGKIAENIVYNSKVSNEYLTKIAEKSVVISSVLTNHADVTCKSYNNVSLRPPFSNRDGSVFHGRILSCQNSNVTTPSDGTACQKASENTTYSKNIGSSSLSIFPNPTSGVVNISISDKVIDKVEVVDALGNTVLSVECDNNEISIDLAKFGTGVYFVKVSSESDTVVEKVVLK